MPRARRVPSMRPRRMTRRTRMLKARRRRRPRTTGRTSSAWTLRAKNNRSPRNALRRGSMASTRTETDSFGPIEVPADAYWGAQTERSIENFPFGAKERLPVEIVHALGFIKQAAARVNDRIGGRRPQAAAGQPRG